MLTRRTIALCVLGAALLYGTPVQAEVPPSGTAAESPNEGAQEQALSEQATDKGTNEVTFRPRIQLRYEHRYRRNSTIMDRTILRLDRPLLDGQLYFRVDVPYTQFDPNQSGETTSRGIGDLYVRAGVLLLDRPHFSLVAGVNAIFPTGNHEEDLGRGKYQVGPILAASVPIPALDIVLFPLIEHSQSVGGDPSTRDVSFTRFSLKMNMPSMDQWWALFEPRWIVDWTRSNKTALNLEFEVGRKMGEHYRAWVRPGVGLWGDTVIGSYDWQLEVGVRYMF